MLRSCFHDGRPLVSSDRSEVGNDVIESVRVPFAADAYVEGLLLPVFCGDRALRIDLLFIMADWKPVAGPALAQGQQLVVVRIREGG